MTSDLKGLLDKIITNAPDALLVVAQIIPLGYGTNSVIQAYNQSIPGLVQQRANAGKHIVAIWHIPAFSSGGAHGDDSTYTAWWQDLYAAHAEIVLNGHDHDYERFVSLDASGQPNPAGVTEFVVGTGGKNHTGFPVPPLTGEVVRDDSSFGVISMTLKPTSYSWRFVPAPGYSFTDSGSANCH